MGRSMLRPYMFRSVSMVETYEAIDQYIKDNLDRYIKETARLCAQPSVSAKGEGMRECAALVGEILTEHGFEVQQFETPGNPVVVGKAAGKSPRTLLCYNHYDVQPPEPLELWTSPPFEPTVREEALYARGAKDDKGELIARLAAVDAVREANGGELPCGIMFVVEGEEEIGSPHIAQFVQEHLDLLKSHGSIWEEGGIAADGSPVLSLGVRGVLSVELSVEKMSRDAHSGGGSVLPNAAWRLVWALGSLKGLDERIRILGFYDRALPPSPLDLELLDSRPSEEDEMRKQLGVKEFLRGATGKQFNRAVFEPTCNIAGIGAGYQGSGMKTVIPARASCKLDFRLVPEQDPEDIFARLRSHLDAEGFQDVEVKWLGAMWPAKASPDDPLVELTARTGKEVYGKEATIIPISGGSSPVYAFALPLHIPVVNAGVGYSGSRTHAPDEHVRFGDFVNGARHIARIMDGFAGL
jgi:acetylornithine deacetylase/succinyl-diaminopimelate desuccinylase-like protein